MDLTVILPIHKYSETYDEMLGECLSTLKYTGADKEVTLMVVAKDSDFKKYTRIDKKNVEFVKIGEDESTVFQHLVNVGVNKCKTEWFSVLEIDDKYTDIMFTNMEKYINSDFASDIMIPLTEIVDYEVRDKGSIGYINEAVWANGFSENIGYLDLDCISDLFTFNMTGAVIKKDDFTSLGGLKESMKVSFWYEFMLRALHNGKTAFVMPKVGYIHTLNRVDSLSEEYSKTISEDETAWWFELAKKEYFFKTDRQKTYE